MKKVFSIMMICIFCIVLQGCDSKTKSKSNIITKEMAYEGVNNYCHENYDWSIAEDNPSIMYVEMKEETDNEYQVEFRSYTGAYVYFYVEKDGGKTKMIEYEPNLDVKNELGTIQILDYLDNKS